MYVCLCNKVTDRQIREAARGGCRRLEDLSAELGVAGNCGSCARMAQEILAESTRAEAPLMPCPLPQHA